MQCPVREILSRPQDFIKKPCFLYLTEVNIFIQDGHLEDLMKQIIKFFVAIAKPILWLVLAKNGQEGIISDKKRKLLGQNFSAQHQASVIRSSMPIELFYTLIKWEIQPRSRGRDNFLSRLRDHLIPFGRFTLFSGPKNPCSMKILKIQTALDGRFMYHFSSSNLRSDKTQRNQFQRSPDSMYSRPNRATVQLYTFGLIHPHISCKINSY